MTIAVDLDVVAEEGALVTTVVTNYVAGEPPPDTLYQIGGRVVDKAGAPIAGALVEALDGQLRATSDTMGRYRLARLPAGAQTVPATATGYARAVRTLTVPGRSEEYVITLTASSRAARRKEQR